MADKFRSFEKLSAVYSDGKDFRIFSRTVEGSRFLIMAPHGGKIEIGTSELATLTAGDDHSLYYFEGLMAKSNRNLHITSHNFFEKTLDDLLGKHEYAIGFHSRQDYDDPKTIYLGGLNRKIVNALNLILSEAEFLATTTGHKFPATRQKNTCNRCVSGIGLQLELPKTLREELVKDKERQNSFVTCIRELLARSE